MLRPGCCFLIVGIRTIRNNPNLRIDVFLLQQAAAKAVINFQNPYTATIPDIYGPSSPYYIPMVENGRAVANSFFRPFQARITERLFSWAKHDVRRAKH